MDGVAGSAAVSTSDPTLVERILQYEICGRISSYRCDIFVMRSALQVTTVMQLLVMREQYK